MVQTVISRMQRVRLVVIASIFTISFMAALLPTPRANAAYEQMMCNSSLSNKYIVLKFDDQSDDYETPVYPGGNCQKVSNPTVRVFILKGSESFRVGYNSNGYQGCQNKAPTNFNPSKAYYKIWFKTYAKDNCKN